MVFTMYAYIRDPSHAAYAIAPRAAIQRCARDKLRHALLMPPPLSLSCAPDMFSLGSAGAATPTPTTKPTENRTTATTSAAETLTIRAVVATP